MQGSRWTNSNLKESINLWALRNLAPSLKLRIPGLDTKGTNAQTITWYRLPAAYIIVAGTRIPVMYKASLRGRHPPPATLSHKEELNKMGMDEADRGVHGFRCKLATWQCQELLCPRKQPGRRMRGRDRKDGEKVQCTGKLFAHHAS